MIRFLTHTTLIAFVLTMAIPCDADANWKQLGERAWRKATEWAHSPSGQKTFRDIVENPKKKERAEKAAKQAKDTYNYIKEGLQDAWNEVSSWNPACTICAMTGKHIACGGS